MHTATPKPQRNANDVQTSGQSNLDPHLIHSSLGPLESHPDQHHDRPLLQGSQSSPQPRNRPHLALKIIATTKIHMYATNSIMTTNDLEPVLLMEEGLLKVISGHANSK